jgi:hypothetical protein
LIRLIVQRSAPVRPLVTYSSEPPQGESNMPSTINLYQIGVWFCVGFFTGAGWAIATWLVGRIFSHI